jgi:hypothetical protein
MMPFILLLFWSVSFGLMAGQNAPALAIASLTDPAS